MKRSWRGENDWEQTHLNVWISGFSLNTHLLIPHTYTTSPAVSWANSWLCCFFYVSLGTVDFWEKKAQTWYKWHYDLLEIQEEIMEFSVNAHLHWRVFYTGWLETLTFLNDHENLGAISYQGVGLTQRKQIRKYCTWNACLKSTDVCHSSGLCLDYLELDIFGPDHWCEIMDTLHR